MKIQFPPILIFAASKKVRLFPMVEKAGRESIRSKGGKVHER